MNKKKAGMVTAVVCFVAAIAITGTYSFNNYRKVQKEMALAEEEQMAEETTTDLIINTAEENEDISMDVSEEVEAEQSELGTTEVEEIETAAETVKASFTEESQMLWPVDGTVLMNYSMDKTVYFKTLEQYKYNPAMIISSAVGDQVIAGAVGTVKSIDNSVQTGITVNVDLGNGYEVFYGQLKDVPLKVGDPVDAKTVVGYVTEPTKYYSLEGINVYFEMRKDGRPVNPMEYLVEAGTNGDGVF